MFERIPIGVAALAAALLATFASAQAFDDAKYPDWKGAWDRIVATWIQPGEPPAPLTAEYQAIHDASVAALARGEPGDAPGTFCLPHGMPMMMTAFDPMELVLTPDVTYVLISHVNDSYRRIYTDGRDWPRDFIPTYTGYSIGKWTDADADGRYNTLEIETRELKASRVFDVSGIPMHKDGQTVIKERIYLDQADRNFLYDQITTIDHALTRPWTVTRKYRRLPDPRRNWISQVCAEGNSYVRIHNESYFLSGDGYLMPMKKDQAPPDLRYFNTTRK